MRWLVCLVAVLGCKSRDHAAPPVTAPPPPPPADAAALPLPPPAPPPVAYVGSERCSDCHDKEYKGWQKSWHARALVARGPEVVVGNFDGAHFAGTLERGVDDARRASARRCARTVPTARSPTSRSTGSIGGKRMQDAVTVFPDGRWQVLPVYFHVAERRRGSTTPRPSRARSRPITRSTGRTRAAWRTTSASTATRPDLARRLRRGGAAVDDDVRRRQRRVRGLPRAGRAPRRQPRRPTSSIPSSRGARRRRGVRALPRPAQAAVPAARPRAPFRLGDDYDELYDPIVVTMPGGGTSSDYFADGRPKHVELRVPGDAAVGVLPQGRRDLPDLPHRAARREASQGRAARGRPTTLLPRLPRRRRRRKAGAHATTRRRACIACHMPPIVSGVLDHFADHAIDVPVPASREHAQA